MDINEINTEFKKFLEEFAPSKSLYSKHGYEMEGELKAAKKRYEKAKADLKTAKDKEKAKAKLAQAKADYDRFSFLVDDVIQDEEEI